MLVALALSLVHLMMAMDPALQLLTGEARDGTADSQDTEAHGNRNAKLFLLLHVEVPEHGPRHQSQDKVGGRRVCLDMSVHACNRCQGTFPTSDKVHDTEVRLRMPALTHDSRVPRRPRVLAPHKHNDGDENVQYDHGNNDKPEKQMYGALCRQAHQADGERRLAHGARHDDKGLRDLTEESDGDGILRSVGEYPLEVMAEAFLHGGFDDGAIADEEDLLV